jgi:hypothetical protein
MLDVHAPEHPLTTRKDFFLHLFTITIGLLIALGLENTAEWVHHVHQRREADANIVSELRDNEHDVDAMLAAIPKERENMIRALKFLDAHAQNKPTDIKGMDLGLTFSTLSDASWQTANANGALSYMEYAHIKRYSGAYTLQAQFNRLQEETLTTYLTVQSNVIAGNDPNQLSQVNAERAKVQVQEALARIVAVEQIGAALRETYEKALKPE